MSNMQLASREINLDFLSLKVLFRDQSHRLRRPLALSLVPTICGNVTYYIFKVNLRCSVRRNVELVNVCYLMAPNDALQSN